LRPLITPPSIGITVFYHHCKPQHHFRRLATSIVYCQRTTHLDSKLTRVLGSSPLGYRFSWMEGWGWDTEYPADGNTCKLRTRVHMQSSFSSHHAFYHGI
jgi:hypothetical protein